MKRSGLWLLIAVALIGVVGQGCAEPPPPANAGPTTLPPTKTSRVLPAESSSSVLYTLFDETVYDQPIKTQIEQHFVVSGIPTAAQLEAELLLRYQATLERSGFHYHNPATNIYIYIYGTEEQARAHQGLWVGMIAKGPLDKGAPTPAIDEVRLAALSSTPEERFGLSEDERKAVFQAIAAAEQRGRNEAMEQVPNTAVMEQIKRERQLQAKYKGAVASQYGVTDSQLTGIMIEGIKKGWPG